MSNWSAYGKNIEILPKSKNKIIGDTSKFYLYGEVVSVGDEVKTIEVGDTIGYTLWGLTDITMEDGTKHYYVQDNCDFILGVMKKNESKASFLAE